MSVEVINGVLMAILMTVNKRKSLPKQCIKNLICLLDKPFGSFILLILNRYDKLVITDTSLLDCISEKLSNEQIVVEHGNSMISFEDPSNDNITNCSVSSLAGQLILKAVEMSTPLGPKAVTNLLTAADKCRDKQTKSISIKCVYLMSVMKNQQQDIFVWDVLMTLQRLIGSDEHLISTYAHAAYVRRLALQSQEQTDCLTTDFMGSLSSMYVTQESLKIGEHNFVHQINEDVLEVLFCETKKTQCIHDQDFFTIMEIIVYQNNCDAFTSKVNDHLYIYFFLFKNQYYVKLGIFHFV